MSAVFPSGETSPAAGGWASGSTTSAVPGAPWSDATSCCRPAGSWRDRVGLAVDDDSRLGAERREVPSQLVTHLHRRRALRLPAGAGERPGEA